MSNAPTSRARQEAAAAGWALARIRRIPTALRSLVKQFCTHVPHPLLYGWAIVALALAGCRESATNDALLVHRQIAEVREGARIELDFYDTRNTDEILAEIAGLKGVQRICFSACDITDQGIKRLSTLPDLNAVTFYQQPRLTDEWIEQLEMCPRLHEITIANLPGPLPNVDMLVKLQPLKTLSIDCPNKSDLLLLGNAKQLTHLNLVGHPDESDIAALQTVLPDCLITVVPNWK